MTAPLAGHASQPRLCAWTSSHLILSRVARPVPISVLTMAWPPAFSPATVQIPALLSTCPHLTAEDDSLACPCPRGAKCSHDQPISTSPRGQTPGTGAFLLLGTCWMSSVTEAGQPQGPLRYSPVTPVLWALTQGERNSDFQQCLIVWPVCATTQGGWRSPVDL